MELLRAKIKDQEGVSSIIQPTPNPGYQNACVCVCASELIHVGRSITLSARVTRVR